MPRRPSAVDSLYLSESEIAVRVLGGDAKRWPEIAGIWERQGLPRIDPLTGKRYWPAVASFLDRHNGLKTEIVPAQADGVETWSVGP